MSEQGNQDKTTHKASQAKVPGRVTALKLFRSGWIVLQVLFVLLIMGALFAGAAGAGYFASHIYDEPLRGYDEIKDHLYDVHQTGEAYFRNGERIGELRTDLNRYTVTINDVSQNLIHAVLATEDNEFYEHDGVNIRGFSRAVREELLTPGQGTGGSTITQQLVKLQILDPERTLERKFREMVLAMRVENMFEKDDILEAYFNIIYFGFNSNGSNIEGVQAAAQGIFDTDVADLNIAQSAYIAGMIQSPGQYTPFTRNGQHNDDNIERGANRAAFVLSRMLTTGRITQEEHDAARDYDYKQDLAEPQPTILDEYPFLTFSIEDRAVEIIAEDILEREGLLRSEVEDFDHIMNRARRELSRGGIKVFTTIDKDLYDGFHAATAAYDFGPRSPNQSFEFLNTETGEVETLGYLEQAAATLLDNESGAILAMVEGRDFNESQINLTTRPFQPGSSAKPILDYAPALNEGVMQPASVIDDVPIFDWGGEEDYARNFTRRYHGLVTVRIALEQSYNIPAIKTFRQLRAQSGQEKMYEYMQNLGLDVHIGPEEMGHDASAIGGLTRGWSVERSTAAYASFANQGAYYRPYMIKRIETMDGELVYQHNPQIVDAFSPETAFLMNDMLRDVVNSGTATRIRQGVGPNLEVAGKTGTTNDQMDYWFIGYTPQVSLGLWFGFQERDRLGNDYSPRNQNFWAELMNTVKEIRPEYVDESLRFEQPSNIVRRSVCSKSGMLPSSLCQEAGFVISDYFNPSFVPTEEDESVIEARSIIVEDETYLALSTTPDDFIIEGDLFIKREPLDIPSHLEHLRDRLLPLDWDMTAPEEEDPRTPTEKEPDIPSPVRIDGNTVLWSPVADEDIAGYRIYRVDSDENLTHIGSVPDHENKLFEDSRVTANYAYFVTAVDILGQESEASDYAFGGDTDGDYFFGPGLPSAPSGLQAQGRISGIDISWNANASAEEVSTYQIYVSQDSTNNFQLLTETANTQYTHQNIAIRTYYYYIIAVNEAGESDQSNTISIDMTEVDPPEEEPPVEEEDEEAEEDEDDI